MGKIRRVRIRGKQRKYPDAALVAQAIIELGRELQRREQHREQGRSGEAASSQPEPTSPAGDDEARS